MDPSSDERETTPRRRPGNGIRRALGVETILVDLPRLYAGAPDSATRWAHLVSDESLDELHAFAASIGLRREWFQQSRVPHYDVTESKRAKALRRGALAVSHRDLVRRAART